MQLRDYQISVIQKARDSISAGNKSIIIQATCGAGKTIISSGICEGALQKGKKVLFLAPRRELIFQAINRFADYGLGDETAILMAGEKPDNSKSIQVASIWTYVKRIQLKNPVHRWFHESDIIIIDECHGSIAPTYEKILSRYNGNTIKIGLSATPARSDGRGLGEIYDKIISAIGIDALTSEGYLVPVTHYGAKHQPDITGLKTKMGDFDKTEAEKRINKDMLVGSIYDNWARLAPERQTIIFAQGVKHSIHIQAVFERNGVSIRHIDAHTPDDERADILRQFENGDIQVITNVGILDQGYDAPIVSCIVLGVITKHIGRFLQMGGRCLRPYPNKTDAIIIDHGTNINRLGFITDEYVWNLNGKEKAWEKKKPKKKEKPPLECSECRHIFKGGKICPKCGKEIENYGKKVEAIEAELQEITKGKAKKHKATMEEKLRFYRMAEYHRRIKKYKPTYAATLYKEKYGVWPNRFKDASPMEPDRGFMNYLTYKAIAYHKRQEKQANA